MTIFAWDGASAYDRVNYKAIWIDGKQFLSTSPISVSKIQAAAGRDASYQFFKEINDDPYVEPLGSAGHDRLLQSTDVIELADGNVFYAIPPAIFNAVDFGAPPPPPETP